MFLDHLNNSNDPAADLFTLEQRILKDIPKLGSVKAFWEEFLKLDWDGQVERLIETILPGAESEAVQVNQLKKISSINARKSFCETQNSKKHFLARSWPRQ